MNIPKLSDYFVFAVAGRIIGLYLGSMFLLSLILGDHDPQSPEPAP